MRDEVAGVAPEARATQLDGTPALDLAAGVRRPARRRGGRPAVARRVHPRGRPTGSPTVATGTTGRFAGAGLAGAVSDRTAELAANLAEVRARIDAACAVGRPGPGRGDARRGHQDLARGRRPAAGRPRRPRRRGEPGPGGGAQGRGLRRPRPALALRRSAADQQGQVGRRATPTSSTRSTGRTSSTPWPRAADAGRAAGRLPGAGAAREPVERPRRCRTRRRARAGRPDRRGGGAASCAG